MGALTKEIVRKEVEARNTDFIKQLHIYSNRAVLNDVRRSPFFRPGPNSWDSGTWNFDSVDVPAAFEMYNQLRENVLNTGYFGAKYFRPYEHTNVNEMGLDKDQPWVGFEFETGYANPDAMRSCLAYCWDNFDNVTFDSEGEGNYYSEVTFAPANLASFVDGSAPASQYIKYLSDNREQTYNSGDANIGTHVNISLPCMRNHPTAFRQVLSDITRSLNRSLGTLSADDNAEFFGRSRLYAGFFHNSDGKGNSWFEGKVFRTTYDYETYQKYVRVSRGLIKMIEALVENPSGYYVSNLYQLLLDPDNVTPVIGVQSEYTTTPTMSYAGYPHDDDDYQEDYCDCDECRHDREDY